jgi:hypothetical protein
MMYPKQLMDGWRKPSNLTRIEEWVTCSLIRTQGQTHQSKKRTPTKATGMHVGGEQTKGKTLMRWMSMH